MMRRITYYVASFVFCLFLLISGGFTDMLRVRAATDLTGTAISSSSYKIYRNKAMIMIPLKTVSLITFKANIKIAEGATVNILKKDGKTIVTQGDITSGMKAKILAKDKKTSKTYTIYRQKPNKWEGESLVVEGTYADAEVIDMGDGTYRMYYCIEPEVEGNDYEMYTAVSKDGRTWSEEGVIRTKSVFPDIVKLSDGTLRMYYCNVNGVLSCTSKDGINWTDDDGIRIDKVDVNGLTADNIGSTTTMLMSDGTYVMLYNFSISEAYNNEVPNNFTGLIVWATSQDGIHFEKKGIAIDSRNDELLGLAGSPEFYQAEDGTVYIYFWSYMGIYRSTYNDGKFSKPVLDYTVWTEKVLDLEFQYPYPSPGDPSLCKIGDKLFMYYGYHQVGIHYVTLK